MKLFFSLIIPFVVTASAISIPKTLYPVPEKRSMDKAAIAAAEPYLALTPEKYLSLVPAESSAPVLTETIGQSSAYNGTICPFCGKTGQWFKYDLVKDPDHVYCVQTGKDILSFQTTGKDVFTDYNGRKYERAFFITPFVKPIEPKTGDVKVYPENYAARERIVALLGTYKGGALMPLARAYYATGDEKYAERAIAILYGFARVMASYPWTVHSSMTPQTREKLLECAAKNDSGFHGWLGPARLAAAEKNFRNPQEAMYFTNICQSYMMLEGAASWKGRREFVLENLIREGSIHFRAYGAKQCVGNAIGMYAPALCNLGIVLQDSYFFEGFVKIMNDFLYNENFHDGISTEGSIAYSSMVGGMWNLFKSSGLAENPEYLKKNPFLKAAGKTGARGTMLRGGTANYGDNHPPQYIISRKTPEKPVPGDEFGGFGVSFIRAGAPDKRLEIVFQHDRVTGHCHDDMLGMQLYYRGIPLLEHFGDTRDTKDLNEKVPDFEKFKALKYPAPIVTKDTRPRGFSVQDMTTPITKNLVMVDDFWESNGWYTAYRGGSGADHRASFGNLIGRTGRSPEMPFQFVEAEGVDKNAKDFQGMRLYRRAFAVVTRPDGTPYVVDFFAIDGGHRHTMLFHSRGREISSTLGKGKDYAHLEDVPGVPDGNFGDIVDNFRIKAGNVLFPGRVLNNVNYGAQVRGGWRHSWEFDYAAWASKTNPPPADMVVKPHILSIHGFITNNCSKAIRADGHFPQTIVETFDGVRRSNRFQFENAVHYAGILAQQRGRIKECYVNCMEFHASDEKPTFKVLRSLSSDGGNSLKRAVEISFEDGTKDIVFWQPFQEESSWDGGLFSSDARCGVIRVNARGRVLYAAMSGGRYVKWHGNAVLQGRGTLMGRLSDMHCDITGHPGKSVMILDGASDWPAGDALKGSSIIAGFSNGFRREVYTIDRIEHKDGKAFVYLADAPFFQDYTGEVSRDDSLYRQNQFAGNEIAKGSGTRYLSGSVVVFPELNKRYHLQGTERASGNYKTAYILSENVNLALEGVKPGMTFTIEPDWKGAYVEVMTTASAEFKIQSLQKKKELGPNARVLPGFIENSDENTLWTATGKDIKVADNHSTFVWKADGCTLGDDGRGGIALKGDGGKIGTYVKLAPGYSWLCMDVASAERTKGGYYAMSLNFLSGGLPILSSVGDILPGVYCLPVLKTPEKPASGYLRIDSFSANIVFNSIDMVRTPPCKISFGSDMLKKGSDVVLKFTLDKPAATIECRFFQAYTMRDVKLFDSGKRISASPVPGSEGREWTVSFKYEGIKSSLAGKNDGVLKPFALVIDVMAGRSSGDFDNYILFNDIPIEL